MKTSKRLVLIGDKESKRYTYFQNACNIYNIDLTFMTYDNIELKRGDIIKLDPFNIKSEELINLKFFVENYTNILNNLATYKDIYFLNHPKEILLCLDKYKSKKILTTCNNKENLLPLTPLIDTDFKNIDELLIYLKENKISQVFIKPRYGAGASGIIALRYNSKKNECAIYTTILYKDNRFYNASKIFHILNQEKIREIVNFTLNLPAIVEKWIIKKKYEGKNYDLRVVMIKQELAYIIPRSSQSPVTNLHLNNAPLEILPREIQENKEKILAICQNIMRKFPLLTYAGIDILITPRNEFLIIEINAQGDSIYQDFYSGNTIYKKQLEVYLKM